MWYNKELSKMLTRVWRPQPNVTDRSALLAPHSAYYKPLSIA